LCCDENRSIIAASHAQLEINLKRHLTSMPNRKIAEDNTKICTNYVTSELPLFQTAALNPL
jgi:hypothetical protein